ncbi:hypothetical protein Tco_1361265, partial [Tanacetum coccineum]
MAKDQAIPRRNKMFWHYAKDDFMFTTVRVIYKHQDTEVYGPLLPQHLTNQAMLESKAYKTYHAYATGEKTPRLKKKKADSESSPKTKSTQASKGKRIKTSAKGDKTKSKGLMVLSEVALSKADQMKLATKRSKKEFHSSHVSGSGDGVDIQSKVPDEQQQTLSGTNEGAGDKPEVPDVPEYRSESEEESWTFSQGDDDDESDEHDSANEGDDQQNDSEESESEDDRDDFVHPNLSTYKANDQEEEIEEEKAEDDDEVTSDQKVSTPPDYELTEEEENQEDDDTMGGEQEDEENGELYGDLNLNLDRQDAEMTGAQTNQETEEAYVTLTTEPPVVQQQSSYVSSDLVSKFINPSPDTGIDSLLNPNVQYDIPVNIAVSITPSSDTTIPQPPILIIQPQQQTHDSTTTTTTPTTTLSERVSTLETEMSEFKQNNQFAEALSSIPGIVDKYISSKMKETVDVAVKLKSGKLREEAQAENQDFLNSLDFDMKRIIKEQVKAQTSKIMSKVEKYVNETLGAKVLNLYNVLVEAYNFYKDLLSAYGDVITIPRGHDDEDKDEEPSARSNQGTKRRRPSKEAESSKEPTHKESRTTSSSKRPSRSQPTDLEDPSHQEFNTRDDDVTATTEVQDACQWHPSTSLTFDCDWHQTKTIYVQPPQPWITQLAQAA